MDRATLYKALRARDKRFDGRFYAGVRTTGIYCRPVCPARPLLKNVTFYRSPAEAEAAGYRPCLRCRPDLSPSAPLFEGTAAVVKRALRLISEGEGDEALGGLAGKLGITDRHLRRLFAEHVGAAPVEVASSKRLHLARLLLSQTSLSVTEVAFASGFRSLRRFNAAFRERYRRAPREFRPGARGFAHARHAGELTLALPYLPPYDWEAQLAFLSRHAVPGIECVRDGAYERELAAGGRLSVRNGSGELLVILDRVSPERLRDVIERVRHLFDLDHNPACMPRALGGIRVPGAFDGFETAVTIILGQLVSTASARRTAGRLFAKHGCTPAAFALSRLGGSGLTRTKAAAIRELARVVACGELLLTRSAPLEETRAKLARIPGIGPWTVELIAMRCLADPDAFPERDLVLARALQSHGAGPDGWRPWRAYLALWLWNNHSRKEGSAVKRRDRRRK